MAPGQKKTPSWNLQTESCTFQPILPGLTIPRNPADPFPLPLAEPGTIPSPGSRGTDRAPSVTFFGILHFLLMDQLQDGIGNWNYPNVDVCKPVDVLRILFLHHLDLPQGKFRAWAASPKSSSCFLGIQWNQLDSPSRLREFYVLSQRFFHISLLLSFLLVENYSPSALRVKTIN